MLVLACLSAAVKLIPASRGFATPLAVALAGVAVMLLVLTGGSATSPATHRTPRSRQAAGAHLLRRPSVRWSRTTSIDLPVEGRIMRKVNAAILLCKFNDVSAEPQARGFYESFFCEAGQGTGGGYDYWRDISYGNVLFEGSTVFGWLTTRHSFQEVGGLTFPGDRLKLWQWGVEAAQDAGINVGAFAVVVVVPITARRVGTVWSSRTRVQPGSRLSSSTRSATPSASTIPGRPTLTRSTVTGGTS
jgi:hypothetical protein